MRVDLPLANIDSVLHSYHAVRHNITEEVSASHLCANKNAWWQCQSFTSWLNFQSNLAGVTNPDPVLKIFVWYVRYSLREESGRNSLKCLANKYIFLVGQIFDVVGDTDPHMYSLGKVDFFLWWKLNQCQHEDPSPTCIFPLWLSLLTQPHKLYRDSSPIMVHLPNVPFSTF